MVLFVGDDWAEDQHDVEVQDATGRRLGKVRLPEGVAGIGRLHALIGEFTDPDDEAGAGQVLVGIETDRGPWVAALVAAGYRVFAVNPMQVARYRERGCTSGAKSDAGDAHVLADMVRTDAHQLRPVAGDTVLVEGIKVVARAHQSLIWDRTRHVLRLRSALREFFPAALEAFDDLAATDALELLAAAPDPETAAGLSRNRIAGALKRARRRDVAGSLSRRLCKLSLGWSSRGGVLAGRGRPGRGRRGLVSSFGRWLLRRAGGGRCVGRGEGFSLWRGLGRVCLRCRGWPATAA
jgi:hypothetical protein